MTVAISKDWVVALTACRPAITFCKYSISWLSLRLWIYKKGIIRFTASISSWSPFRSEIDRGIGCTPSGHISTTLFDSAALQEPKLKPSLSNVIKRSSFEILWHRSRPLGIKRAGVFSSAARRFSNSLVLVYCRMRKYKNLISFWVKLIFDVFC